MPSLKDLKGDEKKEALDRVFRRLNEVFDDHEKVYQRFVSIIAKGNAGGAIATLGFLGAMLGKGGSKPEGVITVLLVFIVGVVAGGATAFFEVLMAGERKSAFERAAKAGGDVDQILFASANPRAYRPMRFGQVMSVLIAILALLIGIILGARLLARLP